VILLALACGSPQERRACRTDGDCGAGSRCEQTTAGGFCGPADTLALDAPAAGALVGAAGKPVAATLTLGKTGSPAPATVALLAAGAPAGALALSAENGRDATYSGSYSPAAGAAGEVSLEAVALVNGEEIRSTAVTVTVDTLAPDVVVAGAACPPRPAGCERDGLLHLRVASGAADVASVTATLDLDPTRKRPLALAAGEWVAEVPLGEYPFPHFSGPLQVTVTAEDQAGNAASSSTVVTVERLRWATAAETVSPPQLTGPAVDGAGKVLVGGSNARLYTFAPDGSAPSSVAVGSIAIAAAPSIGPTAIWVASQDGRIYALDAAGTVLNAGGCNTSSLPVGTPALSAGSPEVSFTGTTTAKALYAARASPLLCDGTTIGDGFASSAVVAGTGNIFAATATSGGSVSVQRFTDPGTGLLTGDWQVSAGTGTEAHLAIDGAGRVLLNPNGTLFAVTDGGTSGSAAALTTLSGRSVESPLVLANGDIVVGAAGGKVHRVTAAGDPVWASPADLGSDVTGLAAAAAAGPDDPVLHGVTVLGRLFALRADGSVAWSASLASGALRFPTIAPARAGRLPTLYAGSADGKLYAVVVDTGLDTTAPWPKAQHDIRNSGNAAAPLP
jgi:hypothetical protein